MKLNKDLDYAGVRLRLLASRAVRVERTDDGSIIHVEGDRHHIVEGHGMHDAVFERVSWPYASEQDTAANMR
jgi:hypothetical protein